MRYDDQLPGQRFHMRRHNGNVFLIHHPSCRLLARTRGFLEEIGLHPVELPSHSEPQLTLVERFEDYASDAYAVILLSRQPADGANGPARFADRDLLVQAGFMAGKLGRRKVALLVEDELEVPAQCSDFLCIPIDDIGIWKFALMRDLVVAGFAVRRELAIMRPERLISVKPTPRAADGT
ncbi:MAG: nucleotide-binding protein [Acidobacteria bacterium]|nr:nucleotide-binding protein [Acidobacteriota bacterium]